MRKLFHNLSLIAVSFLSALTAAAPAPTHLADPAQVWQRLDQVSGLDFARLATKTAAGSLITEPIIRILWAGQLLTDADWIGLKGLASIHQRIDQGGLDDASNMFVYTCRAGWIDLGHVINSGIGYKAFYQGLRGPSPLNLVTSAMLKEPDAALFKTIATELRRGQRRKNKRGQELGYEYWAQYFAVQAGYRVEENQNAKKRKQKLGAFDGEAISAWTLEDLPSNYYGTQIAARMKRQKLVKNVVQNFRQELAALFEQFRVVNLSNKTATSRCGPTAADVLRQDAEYYTRTANQSHVPFRDGDSTSSASPYNYTNRPKKTLSHDCVCDARNFPIDR